MIDNGVGAALHTFDPGEDGKCQGGWFNQHGKWIPCGSSQRSSVLHDDPESDFRQKHDHGGGDCMCFEDRPDGFYGAMKEYVRSRRYSTWMETHIRVRR